MECQILFSGKKKKKSKWCLLKILLRVLSGVPMFRVNKVHLVLMLCMLGKNISVTRRHFEIIFYYFSQKIGFDISCKLSPKGQFA